MDESQVQPESDPIEAPEEAAEESHAEDATAAPPRSRWAMSPWLLAGGLAFAIAGMAWKFGPPNEAGETLARWGLNPVYVFATAVVLLAIALHVRVGERMRAEMETLRGELGEHAANTERELSQAEQVVSRVSPTLNSIAEGLGDVRSLVDVVSSSVGSLEAKLASNERTSLTLAAAVDGLVAHVDLLKRDFSGSKGAKSGGDDLAPVMRLLDSISRDGHSRAARQLEATESVQDTLAAMEGRMRERFEALQPSDPTGRILEEVRKALAQLEQSLGSRSEESSKSLAQKVEAVVASSVSPLRAEVAATASSMKSLAATVASRASAATADTPGALPAAGPQEPEAYLAEGPKESKTVLHAIDKLRTLRGQ